MGLETSAVSWRKDQGWPVYPGQHTCTRGHAWIGLQLGHAKPGDCRGMEAMGRSGENPEYLGQGNLCRRGRALDLSTLALPLVRPDQYRGLQGFDRTDYRRCL